MSITEKDKKERKRRKRRWREEKRRLLREAITERELGIIYARLWGKEALRE